MWKTMLIPFLFVIFTVNVQYQLAAQGGASSIADFILQAKGGNSETVNGDGISEVESCTCVPYYLCNTTSVNNSKGTIDIKVNDRPCNSYIEVCCQIEEPITSTPILITTDIPDSHSINETDVGDMSYPDYLTETTEDYSYPDYVTEKIDNISDAKINIINQSAVNVFSFPALDTRIAVNAGNRGDGIPKVENCTCVPSYLCNTTSVNSDSKHTGAIDIRSDNRRCFHFLEVCCDKYHDVEQSITPTPFLFADISHEENINKTIDDIFKPHNINETIPNTFEDLINKSIADIFDKSSCGYRNPEGLGFKITGNEENESKFGEFPWMVVLLREQTIEDFPYKLNMYQCGGTLIHPQVVLTAAHCVSSKYKVTKIRAGDWDTQHNQELFPYQDRDVDTIIVHPKFYSGSLHNDIAVLRVKSPFQFAENVNTICLPPQGTIMDSKECYATGFGQNKFGKKETFQKIMKKIQLSIVPNDLCQDQLRTWLGQYFKLHQSFICAGGMPGKDTCTGDGGSPLVCPIQGQSNRYYQYGIVSWGIGCAKKKTPGVYVNLPLFRDWIDMQVQGFGLSTADYQA